MPGLSLRTPRGFSASLVFQQHFLKTPPTKQNKKANIYVDSPLNLPGVWLMQKYINR